MKASVIRKLSKDRTRAELEAGRDAIAEREEDVLGVDGEDLGEKLTHIMLALRVVGRVEAGETHKEAFRSELSSVRDLLENEPDE